MFDLKGGRERLGAMAVGGLLLLGAGYVGAQRLRQPGPVVIQSVDSPASSQISAEAPKPTLPSATHEEVVVDVSGAVQKGGVLHLSPGSRVEDALKQAIAKPDADLESLNLAAKLEDGTVVYVPHKDATLNKQPVAESYVGGPAAPAKYSSVAGHASRSSSHASSGPKQPAGKVSLNTGSLAQLETLPGVGPATAQKILDYRAEHGGFGSVDELLAVKGIGDKKLEKLRPWLTL